MSTTWNAITPTTLLAATLVAVLFAAYLWHTFPYVDARVLVATWLGAFTFVVVSGCARWVDGVTTWPVWIGIGALWMWFCVVTAASIFGWRRIRRGRRPRHERTYIP